MKYILFLLISIAILSCSSSDDTDVEPNVEESECQLFQTIRNGEQRDSLVYDDQNRLIADYDFVSESEISLFRYEYQSDKINIYRSSIGSHFPSEEILSRIVSLENGRPASVKRAVNGETELIYNFSGNILNYVIAFEESLEETPLNRDSIVAEYSSDNLNLTRLNDYYYNEVNGYTLGSRIDYVHDEKINPYFNLNFTMFDAFDNDEISLIGNYSTNNILQVKYTDLIDGDDSVDEYSYDYNDQNYPIERVFLNSSNSEVIRFEYDCE